MILLLGWAIFADAQDDPVQVDRAPAACTTRFYDPAHPDIHMPATEPDEAGVTVSDYACITELQGSLLHSVTKGNDIIAEVRVESATLHLRLNVTEWVSQTAGKKILAHEDGHRIISQHFYANADAIAAELARKMQGRSVFGEGLTSDESAKNALNIAAAGMVRDYMIQVRDRSAEVQQAYDEITAHGTNKVDELDAIDQALKQISAAHAQTQPSYH